ncbi:hypothetical protein GCM10023195_19580 [Actinoallomurus liliacearum]|uniref:ABC transporter permease n=1 Tax=Actinoallomurus liliacearum TaxID=1080073 RepID=A0ABP8TG43_9ACTN
MKATTAQEVGRTVRLALRTWGHTFRLVTLVIVVTWLFMATERLPLITW